MKALFVLLSALVLTGLGTSCTQVSHPKAGQGRVLVSAYGAQAPSKTTSLLRSAGTTLRESQGSIPRQSSGLSRNLSAANDISGITYKVTNLANGTTFATGSIDLYSLSVQLFLPPGGNFRIVVDVAIKAGAPGTNVGVTGYGAQTDFQVDAFYDTYVDLFVRPNKALVFDAASVVPGTPATIAPYSVATGAREATPRDFFGGTVTVDPADKLFFGADSDLFYFNKSANTIYRWPNIASAIIPTDNDVVLGATSFDALEGETATDITVQLYAACSDPTTADTLWVVGQDTSDDAWYYFVIDLVNKTVTRSNPITADLQANLSGTITTVPTGIAVDSTYHDVYITFYSQDGTNVESAVLQYYSGSLYAQYPDPGTFTNATSSIFTDVVWEQGKAWVTLSPNTSLAELTAQEGTADILQFDAETFSLIPFTAGAKAYPTDGALPNISTSVTQLALPKQFLGPIQGTKLFVRQQDFLGGAAVVSALDLDTTGVLSH